MEIMSEGKKRTKAKQSSRRLKTSDVLEFIMSDVSHMANTLDRILEIADGFRQANGGKHRQKEADTKTQISLSH